MKDRMVAGAYLEIIRTTQMSLYTEYLGYDNYAGCMRWDDLSACLVLMGLNHPL
jgi:hypothetical protein